MLHTRKQYQKNCPESKIKGRFRVIFRVKLYGYLPFQLINTWHSCMIASHILLPKLTRRFQRSIVETSIMTKRIALVSPLDIYIYSWILQLWTGDWDVANIAWQIWKARNEFVFNRVKVNPLNTVNLILHSKTEQFQSLWANLKQTVMWHYQSQVQMAKFMWFYVMRRER